VVEENKVPEFDGFVAIDWSGAVRNYDGIAVAMCRPGRAAPRLIQAPGVRWTRKTIADWLKSQQGGFSAFTKRDGQQLHQLCGFSYPVTLGKLP
jgi:hypothetical protein